MAIYCLDANCFIEPWNKYYSMKLCPDYWDILDKLAKDGTIFCPVEVAREIEHIDDELAKWVKARQFMIRDINTETQNKLRQILAKHPRLIDTIQGRSMADPWVIAHAMAENGVVVTKELPTGNKSNGRIRIPDVCQEMGVNCIDDHKFAEAIGLKFSVRR